MEISSLSVKYPPISFFEILGAFKIINNADFGITFTTCNGKPNELCVFYLKQKLHHLISFIYNKIRDIFKVKLFTIRVEMSRAWADNSIDVSHLSISHKMFINPNADREGNKWP